MKWKVVLLIVVVASLLVALFVFSNHRWKLAYYEEQERLGLEGKLYPSSDAVPFNSTYKRYGFYPGERMFISHDGLRYQLRDDGGIIVLDQGGFPQLVYGTGVSGNYNGSRIVRTEEDYNWMWTHEEEEIYFIRVEFNSTDDANNVTYVMTEHTFTAYNDAENLNWTQEYKFNPKDDVKITHTLQNNFGDITNGKFWYIMKDTGVVRYNGQVYDTSTTEINTQGNYNNIAPRLEFPSGGFDYEDLLNDNFDLVHLYLGNGSLLDYPNRRVLGLGFTKGSGNFNVGQSITLDPSSTGFQVFSEHSVYQNQWTNPGNAQFSDNSRAETSIFQYYNGTFLWDFSSIPDAANITGIEMTIEGTTNQGFCPIKTNGQLQNYFSLNNFTTESTTSNPLAAVFTFPCSTSLNDVDRTRGSSTEMWGLNSGGDVSGADIENLSARVTHYSGYEVLPDQITVNVYWELPAPVLTALPSTTTSTHGQVSSTNIINISANQALNSAVIETNITGTLTNYTMNLYNSSRNAYLILDGKDLGLDDDLNTTQGGYPNWQYIIWAESGGDYGTYSNYNMSVVSESPNITVNSPNNENYYPSQSVLFNFTNDDAEEDTYDIRLVTEFDSGYNERNYIYFEDSIEYGEDFTHNRTTGELDSEDPNLFRYFKLDGLNYFGENDSATDTNIRDFSNNYSIYEEGSQLHPPQFSTDCETQGCLEFDGTSDVIVLEEGDGRGFFDVINSSEGFTFGGWINRDSSATQFIIAKRAATTPSFFAWTSNSFVIYNSTNGVPCSAFLSGITQNVWYHIAFVFDGNGFDIYKDGNFVERDACTGEFPELNLTRWQTDGADIEVYLGGSGLSGADYELDGTLDEIFIFNRTLSPREIANIHRPIRNGYKWIARSYQSPNDYTDESGTYYYNKPLIEISERKTLQEVYTDLQSELPEDPSLVNLSDGSTPCSYVASRSVDVTPAGELVMDGCTLQLNSTLDTRRLYVAGTLTANYSNFTSWGATNYWFFTAENSNFTLKNSHVEYAGDTDFTTNRRGLELTVDNLVFNNNTFLNNKGIVLLSNNLTLEGLVMRTFYNYNIQNYANNSVIMNSNISAANDYDIWSAEGDISVLSSNYSKFIVSTGAFIYKKWYADVVVRNDSGDGMNNAMVSFYNHSGGLEATGWTNSTGDLRHNITEYVVNSTEDKFYLSNYTINVSLSGYETESRSVNITGNTNLLFNLNIASAGLTCSIDCTITNLVTDSLDCGGGLLEFFGVDRTTDYVQVDAVVSNYNRLEIEQCRVIGGENLVP